MKPKTAELRAAAGQLIQLQHPAPVLKLVEVHILLSREVGRWQGVLLC